MRCDGLSDAESVSGRAVCDTWTERYTTDDNLDPGQGSVSGKRVIMHARAAAMDRPAKSHMLAGFSF